MSEGNKKLPGSLEEWLKSPEDAEAEGIISQQERDCFIAGLVLSALALQSVAIPALADASREIAIHLTIKKDGWTYERAANDFEQTAALARKRYSAAVCQTGKDIAQG